MTSTDETTPAPTPEDAPSPRPPVPWRIIAGVVVAVAMTAGIGLALARDDGSRSDGSRLAAVQQACQDWMNDRGSVAGSDATLCSDMTGWMRDRMHGGRMTGSMMWGDPESMRDTCTQWMSTGPAEIDDPEAWCDDMVGWMDRRAGSWDDWMHG